MPNAEVMLSVGCCCCCFVLFSTHNSSVLYYATFLLRISNCQMNPLSVCQALKGSCSEMEPVFQERVGVLYSTH